MFWIVAEGCLVAAVAIFLFSQVLFPAFTGRPLFWSFRKHGRELAEAEEDIKDVQLQLKIKQLKEELKCLESQLGSSEMKEKEAPE